MKIEKYLRAIHTMYLKDYMDSAAFEEHIQNEGIYQGKNVKLIEQVCQKLRKEKTLEKIADELEEPLEIVEGICKAVDKCGLEADAMEIYEEIQKRINLDKRPEYHKVYRLRDETGHEFSDILEVHVIELNKPLSGTGRMDDWIRLFNAMTEEELKMLEASTKNAGILEAIKEVRVMSLSKYLRLLHEARQKEIRDKAAREDYVRNEGRSEGLKEGRSEGEDIKLIALVQRELQKGKSMSVIEEELEEPIVNVEQIIEAIEKCGLDADASKIYDQMQDAKP